MKTAIFIVDGTTQIVLTPETQLEKNIVNSLPKEGAMSAAVFRGSFYECKGGYHRNANLGSDDSLMFRLDKIEVPPVG